MIRRFPEKESTMNEYPPQDSGLESVTGYQQAPPNSGKAIASMVIGIAGAVIGLPSFCLIGLCATGVMVPCAIVSLILGYMAKREIDESKGTIGGSGMATAGIILGWADVGIAVIATILGILALLGLVGLSFLQQ
jgi:hypothetical protein